MLGWGQARPGLAGVALEAPPHRVVLRGERSAHASLRWRIRLDRPAPRKLEITLTVAVLLGAGLLGAERGGQLDAVTAQYGGVGDWIACTLSLGVRMVTVSGATHMSERKILAIAGVDDKKSLPFFDVAQARARLEADPLIKQASVRKLYPNQIVIEIVERTPYAVWQKDGDVRAIAADGAPIDEVNDGRYADLPFVVGEGANGRVREFAALLDANNFVAEGRRHPHRAFSRDRRSHRQRLRGGAVLAAPADAGLPRPARRHRAGAAGLS